jgi:peptide/nickel transport system permease protein
VSAATAPDRAQLEAEQKKKGQSQAAIIWAQLKKNRAGMAGLVTIAIIVFTALFAPLIANDRPIAVSYKGHTRFPAFTTYVDVWVPWQSMRNSMKSWKVGGGFPFADNWPELEGRSWKQAMAENPADVSWSISPPVPWHPTQIDKAALKQHPSRESGHWLGTDDQGRDVLARIIHGAVVASLVGIVAMGIATTIGLILGVTAGFVGGKVDLVLSRVTEIVMCFPTFFLIIAVISFLERSILNIMAVIGLVSWTGIYRLVRGEVLKVKALDYVMAAHALGVPTRRLMFRHVLPNAVAPVFVSVAFGVAGAVLTETSLSFLGFGDSSLPSWGEIVSQGRQYVVEGLDYLVFWPGAAIFVTLTAFNLFGQGLRDAMDPRLRR